jgi:type II secretory pathway pseudopilin PulG
VTGRDRIVLIVVLCVAAVAGGWMLVVQPRRAQASKLGTQINAEQSQLDSARQQVAEGESARREFAGDFTQVVRLGEAVPANDDVPSLIYQIQGAATHAHVDFRGLQVSATGSASTPSSAVASGSASGAQSSTQLPPGVGMGPAGFPVEQFTFSLQGNFFHLADFFNRLQQFVVAGKNQILIRGRLMTVNGISFSAAPQGFPQITANVSATTYLEQPSQGLTAGATSAGPAGTSSTTTPGASSTPSTPAAAAAVTPVTR